MLNQATMDMLTSMKMTAMAAEFANQLKDPTFNELGFKERLGLLVSAEWNRRQSNKLNRFIRNARFAVPSATVEGIEYHEDRKLDKAQMLRFATCQYIDECVQKLQFMQTGAHNRSVFAGINFCHCVDKVSVNPFGITVPLDVGCTMFKVDGARFAVKVNTTPVPQLECENIGCSADFQHHGICTGTMHSAGRNQYMVVLFDRDSVDKFFCRERLAAVLGRLQGVDHFFRLCTGFDAQIDARGFAGSIQKIVALILCIVHMEMALDVFGQGVNLKRKVLPVHGVQHIKTNGKFLAEACMNTVTQKLTRVRIDKVERRRFHNTGTEIQQQAVFLRNTVKAPSVVAAVIRQVKMCFPPVTAPDTRIKVRHHAERLRRSFG